jgi:hypothetical protein
MPFLLFLLAFMGGVVLHQDHTKENQARGQAEDGQALAAQMAWYHNAALRVCGPSACPPGEITVPEASMNPDGVMAQRFRSMTDGTFIVTTWRSSNINGRGEPSQGAIAAELMKASGNASGVGIFNAADGRVANNIGGIARYELRSVDGHQRMVPVESGSSSLILPTTIAGIPIHNQAAVIASRNGVVAPVANSPIATVAVARMDAIDISMSPSLSYSASPTITLTRTARAFSPIALAAAPVLPECPPPVVVQPTPVVVEPEPEPPPPGDPCTVFGHCS